MGDRQRSEDDDRHKHELEKFLEAVVVNCQHIAAISKGLCVKGVSHDVSLNELSKHEDIADSSPIKILKEEYLRCKKTLAEVVINLSELKEKYLAEYNKGNEKNPATISDNSAADTPAAVADGVVPPPPTPEEPSSSSS